MNLNLSRPPRDWKNNRKFYAGKPESGKPVEIPNWNDWMNWCYKTFPFSDSKLSPTFVTFLRQGLSSKFKKSTGSSPSQPNTDTHWSLKGQTGCNCGISKMEVNREVAWCMWKGALINYHRGWVIERHTLNFNQFSFPGDISGSLAGPDSGVRTFSWESQWKVRTPESELARVPKLPPGLIKK